MNVIKLLDRTGEKLINYQGVCMEIIKYTNARDVDVLFDDGTVLYGTKYQHFKSGKVKNPNFRCVYGVGYMGVGKYKSSENGKNTKEYKTWCGMLERCYDTKSLIKFQTYIGCEVCEDWCNFQNFAKWYQENVWTNELILSPDKDILCHTHNKIYSDKTVLLVDRRINSLFTKADSLRGEYPIGVHFHSRDKIFYSSCSHIDSNGHKKYKYIGSFSTPEEAFYAYKEFKEKYIKQVADEYKTKYENFPQKLYNAMYSYKVKITD